MSVDVVSGVLVSAAALAGAHACLDDLLAADLSAEPDEAMLAALRETERLRRRLSALDHLLITQAEQRGLGYTRAARDTAGLLVTLLRISSREAHARVRAARECGPRTALTGEHLPAVFGDIAAAQGAGVHAEIVASRMTVAELLALKSGDMIELPAAALEAASLNVGGQPRFTVRAGQQNGFVAVQIADKL